MRSKTFVVSAIAAFFLGLCVTPSQAASHLVGYKKIFGHSTSCALGAVSINDTTRKGGSRTINRVGCNSSNAAKAVPKNYISAEVYLQRTISGTPTYVCSGFPAKWNSSSASAVEITAALTVNSVCPTNGYYRSFGANIRKSDAGPSYVIQLEVGNYQF